LAKQLIQHRVKLKLFTHAPEVARNYLPEVDVVPYVLDVGIFQKDSLNEDPEETVSRLDTLYHDTWIDTLAECISGLDGVVVDIAPAALEAAKRAGVPALAIGNFDWAWVYQHYPKLYQWSEKMYQWQQGHRAMQLWPGPGLIGFKEVIPGGVLGREPGRRVDLGIGKCGLVCFGGFGLQDVARFLPVIPGFTWVLAPPMRPLGRSDCCFIDTVSFSSLVASVDLVLTKPGYGILVECWHAGTPIVAVPRGAFPEAPSLVVALRERGGLLVGIEEIAEGVRELVGIGRLERKEVEELGGRVLEALTAKVQRSRGAERKKSD
jgi:hypothetical protein